MPVPTLAAQNRGLPERLGPGVDRDRVGGGARGRPSVTDHEPESRRSHKRQAKSGASWRGLSFRRLLCHGIEAAADQHDRRVRLDRLPRPQQSKLNAVSHQVRCPVLLDHERELQPLARRRAGAPIARARAALVAGSKSANRFHPPRNCGVEPRCSPCSSVPRQPRVRIRSRANIWRCRPSGARGGRSGRHRPPPQPPRFRRADGRRLCPCWRSTRSAGISRRTRRGPDSVRRARADARRNRTSRGPRGGVAVPRRHVRRFKNGELAEELGAACEGAGGRGRLDEAQLAAAASARASRAASCCRWSARWRLASRANPDRPAWSARRRDATAGSTPA